MPSIAMKYLDFLNPEVVSDVERAEKFFPLDEDELDLEENVVDIYQDCNEPVDRFAAFIQYIGKIPRELREAFWAEGETFTAILKTVYLYDKLYKDLFDQTPTDDVMTNVSELTLQKLDQALDRYSLEVDIDEMCPLVVDLSIIEKNEPLTDEENELLAEFCIAAKLAISAIAARSYEFIKAADNAVGGLAADFGYAAVAEHFPENSSAYEAIGGNTGRVAEYKKAMLTI